MNEEELEEKYDRVLELDWEKIDVVKRQPIFIEHGFEKDEKDDQEGEAITLDFRGIKRVDDIHIYAPGAETEIEHFDCTTDGDGVLAWVKKDWSDNQPVKIYWMEPTKDEIALQEMTGIERIETPSTREKRDRKEDDSQ